MIDIIKSAALGIGLIGCVTGVLPVADSEPTEPQRVSGALFQRNSGVVNRMNQQRLMDVGEDKFGVLAVKPCDDCGRPLPYVLQPGFEPLGRSHKDTTWSCVKWSTEKICIPVATTIIATIAFECGPTGYTGEDNCTFQEGCTVIKGCTAGGDCSEAATCTAQEHCSDSEGCTAGGDCSYSTACTEAKVCSSGPNCSVADDCTRGDWCSSGEQCTTGDNCSLNEDCTEGERCSTAKECTNGPNCSDNPGDCTVEGQCTAGENCSSGGKNCTTWSGCTDQADACSTARGCYDPDLTFSGQRCTWDPYCPNEAEPNENQLLSASQSAHKLGRSLGREGGALLALAAVSLFLSLGLRRTTEIC